MAILKCTECGNTFKRDQPEEGQIVACPICEATYEVQIRNGKTVLKGYIYEEKDLGEL